MKKSDLFNPVSIAPRWLAEEFEITATFENENVQEGCFVLVPTVTRDTYDQSGNVKFDARKKYNEVIAFVNPESVPEEFKLRV